MHLRFLSIAFNLTVRIDCEAPAHIGRTPVIRSRSALAGLHGPLTRRRPGPVRAYASEWPAKPWRRHERAMAHDSQLAHADAKLGFIHNRVVVAHRQGLRRMLARQLVEL